jgi:hypothetical protein
MNAPRSLMPRTLHVFGLISAIAACPMACSSSNPGASEGSGSDSGGDGGSSGDTSSSEAASSPDSSDGEGGSSVDGPVGDGNTEMTYSLPAGQCFTLGTATSQPFTAACGDFMALSGSNVDLQSGAGSSQLCLLSGTYSSLASVPASYASCTWTSYVEGGSGLANAGVIVLDRTGEHHYRMRIVSNTQPALVFSFADID